jgi:hypothetical protein
MQAADVEAAAAASSAAAAAVDVAAGWWQYMPYEERRVMLSQEFGCPACLTGHKSSWSNDNSHSGQGVCIQAQCFPLARPCTVAVWQ